MKHGGLEGAVEHERVEGDVCIPQDPGDDNEVQRAVIKQDQGARDCDGNIHQESDGGERDVVLDSTVESPHLQQGRHQAQRYSKDGARTILQCVYLSVLVCKDRLVQMCTKNTVSTGRWICTTGRSKCMCDMQVPGMALCISIQGAMI